MYVYVFNNNISYKLHWRTEDDPYLRRIKQSTIKQVDKNSTYVINSSLQSYQQNNKLYIY